MLCDREPLRAYERPTKEDAMFDQALHSATANPARAYRRPMDVVEASDIAPDEKLAILRAWEADERALQRAEDEGMGGGEHAHLQRVQHAISHVQEH
jgi:hypothetical protein